MSILFFFSKTNQIQCQIILKILLFIFNNGYYKLDYPYGISAGKCMGLKNSSVIYDIIVKKSENPSVRYENLKNRPFLPSVRTDRPFCKTFLPSVRTDRPPRKPFLPSVRMDRPSCKPFLPSVRMDRPPRKPFLPSVRMDRPPRKPFLPSVRMDRPPREIIYAPCIYARPLPKNFRDYYFKIINTTFLFHSLRYIPQTRQTGS